MNLIKKLFNKDIYEGFNEAEYELDLHGWGGNRTWFPETIKEIKPKTIIEVGTWKGQSAINMAQALKDNDIDGQIICIDTWLGGAEHWTDRNPNRWGKPKSQTWVSQSILPISCECKEKRIRKICYSFSKYIINCRKNIKKMGNSS